MEHLSKIVEMGFSIDLQKDGMLKVSPWSKCSSEQREWLKENKEQIVAEIKELKRIKDAGEKMPELRPKEDPEKLSQVGTILSKIIEKTLPKSVLQKVPKETCGCQDYEAKMNKWGADGCLKREAEIVEYLSSKVKHLGLPFTATPKAIVKIAAKRLLHKAISIQRKKDGMRLR
mgnify:CR=1 FL=1